MTEIAVINRSQNVVCDEQPAQHPNNRCFAMVLRVMSAVAYFFQTIAHWFVEAVSWLKDRGINLLLISLDDPRSKFLGAIVALPVDERTFVLQHTLSFISPQMDPNAKSQLIQRVNENSSSLVTWNMFRSVIPEMCSADSIMI